MWGPATERTQTPGAESAPPLGWRVPVTVRAQGRTPRYELGDYDPSRRPDPEGTSTKVGVGVYLVDLDRVDNLDQSFRLDAFLRLSGHDPRLAAVVSAAGVDLAMERR